MSKDIKGCIMQLQHFSVNDGDGIRTTIFMSGCPLRCKWCSNPESWALRPQLAFFKEKCVGCGRCIKICSKKNGECIVCGRCVEVCPEHARKIIGKIMSLEEIKEEIVRYTIFYRYSNGGITYSGGEPTMQLDLLRAMTETFYNMGIHQAIETCGYFNWNDVHDIFEKLDFIFIDIKHMDGIKHRELTGKDNGRILDNIKEIGKLNKTVVIRIPLIKGINDSDKNIKETAEFVRENVPGGMIEILPYHNYGSYKYDALGLSSFKNVFETPDKESIEYLKDLIKSIGVMITEYK